MCSIRVFTVAAVLFGSILIVAPLLGQYKLSAQEPTSVAVSQSIIDIGGEQGEMLQSSLMVTNNGSTTLPISLIVRPATLNGGSVVDFSRSADSFVAILEPQFILGPKESRNVAIEVALPKDAGPGGYYADIITRALVLDDPTRITTTLPELATSLLITVSGDAQNSHTTRSLESGVIFLQPRQEKSLRFSIMNNGNVHSLFTPTLSITDDTGAENSVIGGPILLLPGEQRTLDFALPSEDIEAGAYDTTLRYTFATPAQDVSVNGARLVVLPFSLKWVGAFIVISFALIIYKFRLRVVAALHILFRGGSR